MAKLVQTCSRVRWQEMAKLVQTCSGVQRMLRSEPNQRRRLDHPLWLDHPL
jgi:hypothetical protein